MNCSGKFEGGMIACPVLDAIAANDRQVDIISARCSEQTWNAMVSLELDEEDAIKASEHAASRRETIDHVQEKSPVSRFKIQPDELEAHCGTPEGGPEYEHVDGYIAVTCQSGAINERARRLLMRMIISEETLAE